MGTIGGVVTVGATGVAGTPPAAMATEAAAEPVLMGIPAVEAVPEVLVDTSPPEAAWTTETVSPAGEVLQAVVAPLEASQVVVPALLEGAAISAGALSSAGELSSEGETSSRATSSAVAASSAAAKALITGVK